MSLSTTYTHLIQSGAIVQDDAQREVAMKLDAFASRIAHYTLPKRGWFSGLISKNIIPSPQGIYIYGDVGRGKSMLMDLFFQQVQVTAKRRVHFHAFMLEVHERLFALRSGERQIHDPIPVLSQDIAAQASLLCFDEFHVTDIADAMLLGRLFTALFALGVVVVATSNRHPDALYKDGLQRERFLPFIALLKEKVEVCSLNALTDYRLERMKAMRTLYYTPLGEEANSFMHQTFATLTQHAPVVENRLHVQGRELVLPLTAGGIAMASFAELCEQPLGSADYLEIAQEFSTLLLTDIPKLTPEMRNEAKRFVTLIDTLYERKVKLICSAAVPVASLYTEGTGAFEFERTISRLMEMQSEDYWKGAHGE
jgi:cell division protein ZapE